MNPGLNSPKILLMALPSTPETMLMVRSFSTGLVDFIGVIIVRT